MFSLGTVASSLRKSTLIERKAELEEMLDQARAVSTPESRGVRVCLCLFGRQ